MRELLAALILSAGLVGCGSQPSSNGAAAAPGAPAVTGDMSDAEAMKEIGVTACVERATSGKAASATPAQRQSCACAVDRLAAGKSTEEVQAMWLASDYRQTEEQARASCEGG